MCAPAATPHANCSNFTQAQASSLEWTASAPVEVAKAGHTTTPLTINGSASFALYGGYSQVGDAQPFPTVWLQAPHSPYF